ncbi:superoxide dismutase [Bdellovibrio bacteriovorus]|uniref:Superoxide dismutase [Cu-Zn] n=1 Tax=Bdellovibrio bacteriovorus TaxID=959 RepID=A0A150WRH6_BDEBC|nr:superoxide dismutase family protein [Bdellovibrio bacteriovorus]KYG66968.1 superoxide dismutase [Bdellovibrio bacteriovorus]
MKTVIALTLISAMMISCSHSQKKAEETTAAVTPVAPAPTRAQAVLKAANGQKVKGIIHFTEENGAMKVESMVEGLKAGPHGFHIHEVGDCSKADFASAGPHFTVSSTHQHGSLDSKARHEGDLGNLMANGKGVAKSTITVNGVTLKSAPNGILGRAVVIHKDKDDFKSQPAGNSGARIACGIIEAVN